MSRDYPEEKIMTKRDAEMYVQGAYDLMMMVGGDGHCKSYDPLTFFEGQAHSYVLNLEDGGRHHPYKTPDLVADMALLEFAEEFIEEFKDGGMHWNEYYKEILEAKIKEATQ